MATDPKTSSLSYAELLMQAGINLTRQGKREKAVPLFEDAERRFESIEFESEAQLAHAWAAVARKKLKSASALLVPAA